LTAETQIRIMRDWLEIQTECCCDGEMPVQWTEESVRWTLNGLGFGTNRGLISVYLGTYNDSVVFIKQDGCADWWITYEIAAEHAFAYIMYERVLVWNDGEFYSPSGAFNAGLLTAEEIGQISALHRQHEQSWGYQEHSGVCELCGTCFDELQCSRCENVSCAENCSRFSRHPMFCQSCDCCLHFERSRDCWKCGCQM
jgi:hypothetical protein